jgi:hypothetical protein
MDKLHEHDPSIVSLGRATRQITLGRRRRSKMSKFYARVEVGLNKGLTPEKGWKGVRSIVFDLLDHLP